MTEKEAWLELAEMFEGNNGTPDLGLCDNITKLWEKDLIDFRTEDSMVYRLSLFDNGQVFYWPRNTRRPTRDLRVTACGFLAAMCDD